MPTYTTTPDAGVIYSLARLEAAHTAPSDVIIYQTVEIYHPVGTPDGPLYLVGNTRDFVATKEADAVRDPGATVTYMAAPVELAPLPEGADAAAPTTSLRFINIGAEAAAAIRLARGSQVPWELVARVYASNDPTGPAQLPPLSLLIDQVSLAGAEVVLGLGYGDPANVSVPVLKFRRINYPTLQP